MLRPVEGVERNDAEARVVRLVGDIVAGIQLGASVWAACRAVVDVDQLEQASIGAQQPYLVDVRRRVVPDGPEVDHPVAEVVTVDRPDQILVAETLLRLVVDRGCRVVVEMGGGGENLHREAVDPDNPCGPVLFESGPSCIATRRGACFIVVVECGEAYRVAVVQIDLQRMTSDAVRGDRVTVRDRAAAVGDDKLAVDRDRFALLVAALVVQVRCLFERKCLPGILAEQHRSAERTPCQHREQV